jgi:hypothetical protein
LFLGLAQLIKLLGVLAHQLFQLFLGSLVLVFADLLVLFQLFRSLSPSRRTLRSDTFLLFNFFFTSLTSLCGVVP